MSSVDNVLDAVDRVREDYDKYEDDSNCRVLEMMELGGSGRLGTVQQMQLDTCKLMANTTALDLSSVAGVLTNANR